MIEQDVLFDSHSATLSGTLTLPEQHGSFPAVILIPGSGRIDRDENHKKMKLNVFNEFAVYFADKGIASLCYDKRGIGKSTGDYFSAGLQDNIFDANSALEFLRKQKNINRHKIFLIGHSEGAMIATCLAKNNPTIAGVVLLAGAARDGESILKWQLQEILAKLPCWKRFLLRILPINPQKTQQKFVDKINKSNKSVLRFMFFIKINAKWFREMLQYDPAKNFPEIVVPILAITGKKDIQVPFEDLEKMKVLTKSPIETHAPDNLTHILRDDDQSASIAHYKKLKKFPVEKYLLHRVVNWLIRTHYY